MFIVLVYDFDLLVTKKHIWNLSLDVASRVPRDEGRRLCSRPCEFSVHESLNMCVYVSHFVCVCVLCVCVCLCVFCLSNVFGHPHWDDVFQLFARSMENLHISRLLWSCLFFFAFYLPSFTPCFLSNQSPERALSGVGIVQKKVCPNCTSFTLTVAKSFLPRL